MGATVIGRVLVIIWMTPGPKANAKSLSRGEVASPSNHMQSSQGIVCFEL